MDQLEGKEQNSELSAENLLRDIAQLEADDCLGIGGEACSNGEGCVQWMDASDAENCCSSCLSDSEDPATPLLCSNVTSASYAGSFTSSQWLTFSYEDPDNMPPWGAVSSGGWENYYRNPSPSGRVVIYSPDNYLVEENYGGGALTFTCDGVEISVEVPAFTDIGEEGFIDENGVYFDTGFYVGIDGLLYYDLDLTKKV